jgi:hypothetical protein
LSSSWTQIEPKEQKRSIYFICAVRFSSLARLKVKPHFDFEDLLEIQIKLVKELCTAKTQLNAEHNFLKKSRTKMQFLFKDK